MIEYVAAPPAEPRIARDPGGPSEARDVAEIAEILSTPLQVAYSWSCVESDRRLRKLYHLGKTRGWNVDLDIDWSVAFSREQSPVVAEGSDPYAGWAPYDRLTDAERLEFTWHHNAWTLSQLMHGEQAALLVASQLVNCAPSYDAKLYAATQVMDEARHLEAFSRYLNTRIGIVYPINRQLKSLLDKILTDARWDLKFIGMQLIVEALALSVLDIQKAFSADPVVRQICAMISRDESRHVAFGVTYMDGLVQALTRDEVAYRARFALEACRLMRDRIVPTDVYSHYESRGFTVEEGRRRFLGAGEMETFRNLLFTRIMPNLARIGLITDEVKPGYEQLGLLAYCQPSSAEIDWLELERPYTTGE
jgi:hypothetical protein